MVFSLATIGRIMFKNYSQDSNSTIPEVVERGAGGQTIERTLEAPQSLSAHAPPFTPSSVPPYAIAFNSGEAQVPYAQATFVSPEDAAMYETATAVVTKTY